MIARLQVFLSLLVALAAKLAASFQKKSFVSLDKRSDSFTAEKEMEVARAVYDGPG